jgi:hypothetical protein
LKKLFLIIAAIVVAFAVLLPFASKTPDGLETLTEASGNQHEPIWNGLMADYSVALADPYVSTLVAGLFGTGTVIFASFMLSATVSSRKKPSAPEI